MKPSYKITNTTRKPPRIDRKTGKDLRTKLEEVGYFVNWRDEKDNPISLAPGKFTFRSFIPENLLKQHKAGAIKIEEFKGGISEQMKEFAKSNEKKEPAKATKVAAIESDSSGENKTVTTPQADKAKAKATLMGESTESDNVSEKGGYPGAVNPDGPNKHTVVAPSSEKKTPNNHTVVAKSKKSAKK